MTQSFYPHGTGAAPAPGIPQDTPAVETFLQHDVLQAASFSNDDIDAVLAAAGDSAASPAARAASARQDLEERRKIVEAAEIMYLRRARATEQNVQQAMQRSGSPYFLPACPTGNSSQHCPLARRLGFAVHYLWDNHSDQVMFGLRLSGGLGQPRYFIVQGAPAREIQQNPNIPPYDRHMAAVNATRIIAGELGISPEAVVDTAQNRISIGQNTLVYCRLEEFNAWWERLRVEDQRTRKAALTEYVDSLHAAGATRHVTPFVATLGEIADRKRHAQREDRSFSGQVGGFRPQRVG